jgi:hypothetical protein
MNLPPFANKQSTYKSFAVRNPFVTGKVSLEGINNTRLKRLKTAG